MQQNLTTIGFDADDTLWHNEHYALTWDVEHNAVPYEATRFREIKDLAGLAELVADIG